MRSLFIFIWEVIKIVIIALAIVLPIRYFIFQPFIVKGESMMPTFAQGDYLIIDELSYRFKDPQRGEVIVFKYPMVSSQKYIKRIIGLPGEKIEIKNGQVLISNQEGSQVLDESEYLPRDIMTPGQVTIILAQDEYFVLGDNRYGSVDSRRWGPLKRKDIIGRVFIRAWPISALAKIQTPTYINE